MSWKYYTKCIYIIFYIGLELKKKERIIIYEN